MDSNALEDEIFTRYLLRSLPDEEAERIDEMSVTDDEVAWRLRAIEDDLVDAYVRGELTGERRTQFENIYLATPGRRNRLARARALATVADAQPGILSGWRKWAVAAALVIAVSSFWLISLRDTTAPPPDPVAVASPPTASVPVTPPPPTVAPAPQMAIPTTVVSLFLPAPTRAARGLATLPSGVDQVVLRLQLEANDYPSYRGALRDLQRNEITWRSEPVAATREEGAEIVAFTLAGTILDEKNYSLELSGVLPSGRTELIASYPFSVRKD